MAAVIATLIPTETGGLRLAQQSEPALNRAR